MDSSDDNAENYDDDENGDFDEQIPIAIPVGAMLNDDDDDDDDEGDVDGDDDDDDDDDAADATAEVDETMIEADEGVDDIIINYDVEEEDAGVSSIGGDILAEDDETGSSFCGTEEDNKLSAPPPTKIIDGNESSNKRGRKKRCNSDLSELSTQKKKSKRDSLDSTIHYDDEDEDEEDNGGKIKRVSTNLTTGLTIPFRTVKRLMKNDTTIGIVQNDAAIVVTAALEMFVKDLARKSLTLANNNGRNIIKYEDVATVRTNDRSLSFLDLLLP